MELIYTHYIDKCSIEEFGKQIELLLDMKEFYNIKDWKISNDEWTNQIKISIKYKEGE